MYIFKWGRWSSKAKVKAVHLGEGNSDIKPRDMWNISNLLVRDFT